MRSLRKKINAMCKDCIYDPNAAGGVAVQIELCNAYKCPLWPVRPIRQRSHRRQGGYSGKVREFYELSNEEATARLENPLNRKLMNFIRPMPTL